jgi:hypothetical protein
MFPVQGEIGISENNNIKTAFATFMNTIECTRAHFTNLTVEINERYREPLWNMNMV